MAKAAYIGEPTKKNALKFLEYIESSGTQYIDTGVTGGTNASFEMTARMVSTNSRNNNQSFGTIKNFCSINGTSSQFRVEDVNLGVLNFTYTPTQKWTVKVDSDGKVYCDGAYIGTMSALAGRGWGGSAYGNWIFYTSDDGINFATSMELYSLKMYTDGVIVRDYAPCQTADGQIGLYDKANNQFYANAGTGTFAAGAVVEEIGGEIVEVARISKKISLGIEGIARKVKKAWIGVNGVARLFFGGGELKYYGTATPLSVARRTLAATSVGNYAIFGGGDFGNSQSYTSITDAYDTSLTQIGVSNGTGGVIDYAATSIGNYALFGGGLQRTASSSSSTYRKAVYAYDASLTQSTPTALRTATRYLSAASVGNYAIFGGGRSTNTTYTTQVNAYDASLTRSNAPDFTSTRIDYAAASVGGYALFSGGVAASESSRVDAYDASLTRSNPTELSVARYRLAAASVGGYALFAGGYSSLDVTDAYDASLTRSTPAKLSVGRCRIFATSVEGHALFAGGLNGSAYSNVVDVYDESLTRTVFTPLSQARYGGGVTTIGDYALFGGGQSSTGPSDIVNVYQVS